MPSNDDSTPDGDSTLQVSALEEKPAETEKKLTDAEVWQNIGFHRPLAGFFYNLVFWIVGIFFGAFVGGWLYSIMYPFPESLGYKTAATAIFALFFQVWDLGTANVVNRYMGENSVKNPHKMILYVQYFISEYNRIDPGLVYLHICPIFYSAFATFLRGVDHGRVLHRAISRIFVDIQGYPWLVAAISQDHDLEFSDR
jgi:hypothetical protein